MIEVPADVPNPGSDAAVAKGCGCPVIDNARGAGSGQGPGLFWVDAGCPLHGLAASIALEALRNKKPTEKKP